MESQYTVSTATLPPTPEEILALKHIIARRFEWLGNESNRLRSTYEAVAADTRRLEEHLNEMIKEFNENQNK